MLDMQIYTAYNIPLQMLYSVTIYEVVFVHVVAATVTLLTLLLSFVDSKYCVSADCVFTPIHVVQLLVSVEVAASLIFLVLYLGKLVCLLLYYYVHIIFFIFCFFLRCLLHINFKQCRYTLYHFLLHYA